MSSGWRSHGSRRRPLDRVRAVRWEHVLLVVSLLAMATGASAGARPWSMPVLGASIVAAGASILLHLRTERRKRLRHR